MALARRARPCTGCCDFAGRVGHADTAFFFIRDGIVSAPRPSEGEARKPKDRGSRLARQSG